MIAVIEISCLFSVLITIFSQICLLKVVLFYDRHGPVFLPTIFKLSLKLVFGPQVCSLCVWPTAPTAALDASVVSVHFLLKSGCDSETWLVNQFFNLLKAVFASKSNSTAVFLDIYCEILPFSPYPVIPRNPLNCLRVLGSGFIFTIEPIERWEQRD
ncbi:hypothetical protein FF38_10842 [Lucilia cuprina]|uniref:Uncharacterized protein n=1 Tax=Lucilia cuprina TaxID=7375 RepID=A0A0L0BVU3_LUCCU|nr:hypothetical protein FF38_10842 [Lucilia cuprina]